MNASAFADRFVDLDYAADAVEQARQAGTLTTSRHGDALILAGIVLDGQELVLAQIAASDQLVRLA